jgi:predicted nucleic acid-binding protein
MPEVLDAHALMVFLEKEPGHEKVERHFTAAVEKDEPLLMTTVNYGEVLYIILRECGRPKVQEIESIIQTLPIKLVNADLDLARKAAHFKALKNISYADCFAAALAKLRRAVLITGDKEFKTLEKEIRIFWI